MPCLCRKALTAGLQLRRIRACLQVVYPMGEGNAAGKDRLVLPGRPREQELVEPGALLSVTPTGLAVEKAEGRSQCPYNQRVPQTPAELMRLTAVQAHCQFG
jgi:hypothetical protein